MAARIGTYHLMRFEDFLLKEPLECQVPNPS
jgi:hypothetical protein